MSVEMFAFKFNLGPETLKLYEHDMKQVKETVIPDALNKIFDNLKNKENLYLYQVKNAHQEVIASNEYQEMISLKNKSVELYDEVFATYNKTGEIRYSSDYMDTRQQLKGKIDDVTKRFPFLEMAFLRKNVLKVDAYSDVKMNVTYINKASKIEQEIEDMKHGIDTDIKFIYDSGNENIYINAGIGEKKSAEISGSIEQIINTHASETNIGEINIRPLYSDSLTIKEGTYNVVEVETVFPNGSAKRRSDAISYYNEINAKKISEKYEAEKGESLNLDGIIDENMQIDAQLGYLKIMSKGKNIIKNAIKTVAVKF